MHDIISCLKGFRYDPSFAVLAKIWIFMLGTCVASFMNVCIWRIPRGESVSKPASHCPKCNAKIEWYQNIPVLSWLCLRGRCANCKERISARYPLVELLGGALFLASCMKYASPETLAMDPASSPWVVPALWLVSAGAILGSFVDIDHRYLPDRVTLGGVAAGFALSCAIPELQHEETTLRAAAMSAAGAAGAAFSLWLVGAACSKIFRREAMGFGDVKLVAAIGAFFGPGGAAFAIVAASLAGSVAGIALILAGRTRLGSFKEIPFGPYLAAGALAWAFWGPKITMWYIGIVAPAQGAA